MKNIIVKEELIISDCKAIATLEYKPHYCNVCVEFHCDIRNLRFHPRFNWHYKDTSWADNYFTIGWYDKQLNEEQAVEFYNLAIDEFKSMVE